MLGGENTERIFPECTRTTRRYYRYVQKDSCPRDRPKLAVARRTHGRITLCLSSGSKLSMYADNTYPQKVLGLQSTEIKASDDNWRQARGIVLKRLALAGTQILRPNTVYVLHFYAAIIEHQHASNFIAPRAAYVYITKSPEERVDHISNPPGYLPVDTSYIGTLNIRIDDDHGNVIMLANDGEKVVVRLHVPKAN